MQNFTPKEVEALGISPSHTNLNYSRHDRDSLYMEMAKLIAKRSHDSETQHGCVAIKNDRIIGAGCNGFPAGMPDGIIPNTRPHKYKFVNHSEENLIYHAAREGFSLNGATLYVTGRPCSRCARQLVSVGIKKWIMGNRGHKHSEEDYALYKFWVEFGNVEEIWYGK